MTMSGVTEGNQRGRSEEGRELINCCRDTNMLGSGKIF